MMLASMAVFSFVAVSANGVAHKACSRPARLLKAQRRRAPQLVHNSKTAGQQKAAFGASKICQRFVSRDVFCFTSPVFRSR
jgi:hypothetical protein